MKGPMMEIAKMLKQMSTTRPAEVNQFAFPRFVSSGMRPELQNVAYVAVRINKLFLTTTSFNATDML